MFQSVVTDIMAAVLTGEETTSWCDPTQHVKVAFRNETNGKNNPSIAIVR
ncbi:hypothetical protein [Streptomyces sp. NPDC029674]